MSPAHEQASAHPGTMRSQMFSPSAAIRISAQGVSKMKPSTKNEIAGKVHEVKGKIKEKVGQMTNDPDLEGKGIGEKIAGKIEKKIGQVQKVVESIESEHRSHNRATESQI